MKLLLHIAAIVLFMFVFFEESRAMYYKRSEPPQQLDFPDYNACVKFDTDTWGKDRANGMQQFPSLMECINWCIADPKCKAIVYNEKTQKCFQKWGEGIYTSYAGAYSAFMSCYPDRELLQPWPQPEPTTEAPVATEAPEPEILVEPEPQVQVLPPVEPEPEILVLPPVEPVPEILVLPPVAPEPEIESLVVDLNSANEMKHLGCWKDDSARTMDTQLSDVTSVEECAKQVKAKGWKTFGVQYDHECWSSENADATYDDLGEASGCKNGRGGDWMQNVYQLGCVNVGKNLQSRVNPKEGKTNSWSECAQKCQDRVGCTNWLYHHADAGQYANICVTMEGFGYSNDDALTTSGDHSCFQNLVELVNVADGKTAIQRSTAYGGDPNRGIDGNSDPNFGGSSCTHTDKEDSPWWAVDLEVANFVYKVKLHNRQDCCADRLTDVVVYLSNEKPIEGQDLQSLSQCGNYDGTVGESAEISCEDTSKKFQYVIVTIKGPQYLTLCEVEVFAPPPPERPMESVVPEINSEQCQQSKLGLEYTGQKSTTVNGKTCQRWASQSPHTHTKTADNIVEDTLEDADNFCRNPDKYEDGLWCYTTDEDTRWELCEVEACKECKTTKLGLEYGGRKATTESGKTCQRWDAQTPHKHKQKSINIVDASLSTAENYCRNPDKASGGLWCYTTDPDTRWEYCDVDICTDSGCTSTKLGLEYTGQAAKTESGKVCQRWDSQTPHSHSQTADNIVEDKLSDAENYCRNPDKYSEGLWCYTSDSSKRWERCDVPECPGAETKPEVELVNVAEGKSAIQRSTAYGGDPNRGVDGNAYTNYGDNSCTHTDKEDNPWWAVDLEVANFVHKVKLHNRQDCCADRLTDVVVYLSNEKPTEGQDLKSLTKCGDHYGTVGSTAEVSCKDTSKKFQYVIVTIKGPQYLTLCEVEVFAPPPPPIAVKDFGCWKDDSARTMDTQLSDVTSVDECAKQVKAKGWTTFGVQYDHECWSSEDAEETYNDLGEASGCKNGRGGDWMQNVYQLKDILGKLQRSLDAYCRDTVQKQNKACKGAVHARKGVDKNGKGPAWRCYHNVKPTTTGDYCVDDQGELALCEEPIPKGGKYCSRDVAIKALIEDSHKAANEPVRCTPDALGTKYTGRKTTTVGNKTCQRWDAQAPHTHSQTADNLIEDTLTDASNFCRNPDGFEKGLWCYTTEDDTRWELCDVEICKGEVQQSLDTYCRDTVQNEHKDCVGAVHARKGKDKKGKGPAWRCYHNLKATSGDYCIGDDGEAAECEEPNPAKGMYCSRDVAIKAMLAETHQAAHESTCPIQTNQNLYSNDAVVSQKTDTKEECAELCRPNHKAVAWKWHDETVTGYEKSCGCLGSYDHKMKTNGVYSETFTCKDCEVWKNNNLYSYDAVLSDKTDNYQACSELCSTIKEAVAWKWHDSTKGKWANGCYCLGSYTQKAAESGVFSAERNC